MCRLRSLPFGAARSVWLSRVFQKEVVPFLTRAFMPIVETIFTGLRQPVDGDDEVVSSSSEDR